MIFCISLALVAIFSKYLLNQICPKLSNMPILCACMAYCAILISKYKEATSLASQIVHIDSSILNMANTILLISVGEKICDTAGEKGLSNIIKSIGLCLVTINAISIFSKAISDLINGGII